MALKLKKFKSIKLVSLIDGHTYVERSETEKEVVSTVLSENTFFYGIVINRSMKLRSLWKNLSIRIKNVKKEN